jgi:PadR family transcriptional regulator, regulatory protein PadR
MKLFRSSLGEFEELVMIIVAILGDKAYGVAVQEEIKKQSGREISISAIHSVLTRLEQKNYLLSWMGGQTDERGGRRKRYFKLTGSGKQALRDLKKLRDDLWKLLPEIG